MMQQVQSEQDVRLNGTFRPSGHGAGTSSLPGEGLERQKDANLMSLIQRR